MNAEFACTKRPMKIPAVRAIIFGLLMSCGGLGPATGTELKDLDAIAFLATYGASEKVEWEAFNNTIIREKHSAAFVYRFEKRPCLFRFQTAFPPYEAIQIDFSKLGSRYEIRFTGNRAERWRLSIDGQPGASCAVRGEKSVVWTEDKKFKKTILTESCDVGYDIEAFNLRELQRFRDAITYIQSNFCPPLPSKPY